MPSIPNRRAVSGLIQPIKWYGGKSYLAKRIIAEMPPRCRSPNKPANNDPGWLHYVEPFFGGGAVLLAQDPEGISEVVNDLSRELIDFWRCLAERGNFEEFQRIVQTVQFSQYEWAATIGGGDFTPSRVAVAVRFFVRCRQSMSGRMKNFTPLTRNRTRRGMNAEASAWLSAIDGLPEVHTRLKRVVILNDEATKVIKQQDGSRTLFYLDPPYIHSTRATTGQYAHEMSDSEHATLLNVLESIKGRFILSGYPSNLYRSAAIRNGWRCIEVEIDNKVSGAKEKPREIECLWMNY